MESRVEQPGMIAQTSKFHRIIMGELEGPVSERLRRIQSCFKKAGINCEISTNIRQEFWRKFLFLCAFAEVTSITRSSIGEVLKFADTKSLVTKVMDEIVRVGISQGATLGPTDIDAALQTAEQFEYQSRTSMQRDVESDRPSEIDSLTGKVVELGRQYNVPTPLHDIIYTCLRIQHLRNMQKLSQTLSVVRNSAR